jgi:hypothetical protein
VPRTPTDEELILALDPDMPSMWIGLQRTADGAEQWEGGRPGIRSRLPLHPPPQGSTGVLRVRANSVHYVELGPEIIHQMGDLVLEWDLPATP